MLKELEEKNLRIYELMNENERLSFFEKKNTENEIKIQNLCDEINYMSKALSKKSEELDNLKGKFIKLENSIIETKRNFSYDYSNREIHSKNKS